jgi:hypothetical protein
MSDTPSLEVLEVLGYYYVGGFYSMVVLSYLLEGTFQAMNI